MRRAKADADITRESLIDAGLRVFSRKGYTATTLDDVADEAGVTRGALYWHFGGKSGLYQAVVQERVSAAQDLFRNIVADGGQPLDVLRRLLVRSMEYVEEDPQYKAVLELTLFKTEVTAEMANGLSMKAENLRQMVAQLADLIARGKALGHTKQTLDPESAALAAVGLYSGLLCLWLMNPGSFSIKERAGAIVDLFLSGISTSKA